MLLSDWRLKLAGPMVGLAVMLSACGFTPAYGPGGNAQTLTNNVTITEPGNRQQYLMGQQIDRRLGHAAAGEYTLSLGVSTSEVRIAVTNTAITNRYEILGSATYSLADSAGTTITSGTVTGFTAYSAAGNTVTTTAAKKDATERLMVILADQIVTRLIAAAPAG